MADEMIGNVAKADPEGLLSLYDLEYRENEDGAWYSVYVVLDAGEQTLTVNYFCTPEYKVVFSTEEFETEAEVDELVLRFRPLSRQLEDHQCGNLLIGATVCAAHGDDNDLRFYDAVIETVDRQAHSFADGEEVCVCNFVLSWQHGRGRGTLTSANIERICIAEPGGQLDPRISAFTVAAKKKITSSKSISARKQNRVSIVKIPESFQNKPSEQDTSMTVKSLMSKSEDLGKIGNYHEWTSQDEDMGPKSCIIDGAGGNDHYFILINNLEKDLTPSSINEFIYEQTAILPQTFIFPRLLSDPFARGVIMVDCQKEVQTIYEFLDNPNHLVVSSRGRPWVITEKASTGTFGKSMWNLIPIALDKIKSKRTNKMNRANKDLKVVLSGTGTYERAKQLRDLLVDFINHESRLFKWLVLQERKILQSCRAA